MKNVFRRLLSVTLAIAILTGGFFIFDPTALFPTAQAQVTVSDSAASEPVRFIVPEAVYLKPVWNAYYAAGTHTFQWYVNNAVDAAGNIVCETGEDAVGDIYFSYAHASAASIRFEWLDASGTVTSGGSVTYGDGTAKAFNAEYAIASSEEPLHITAGTSCTMTAAQTGAYIRWTVTYTDTADNRVKTVKAYTYVYKPYVQPVGVALRTLNDRGTDSFGQNISWVSGVHDMSSDSSGTYYPNTCLSADGFGLLPFSSGAVNGLRVGDLYAQFGSEDASKSRFYCTGISNKGSVGWLNQIANPSYVPDKSMHYVNNATSGSNTGDNAFYTFGYSPRAVLTVDKSRYTNLNQIPNLSVGLMVTDDDSSEGSGAWFVSNYTGTPASVTLASYEKNSTSVSEALWNTYKTSDLLASAGSYTSSTWAADAEKEGVKYNGRWTRTIRSDTESGVYCIGTGYFNHDDTDSDHCGGDTVWNVSELRTYIHFYDKSALRTAVQTAIACSGRLDPTFYDTTSVYWMNYQNLYHAASLALTKLDGTIAVSVFVNGGSMGYIDPEALASDLTDAVNALLAGAGRISGTAVQTDIALQKQPDSTYKITKFRTNSKSFPSDSHVTLCGDGFEGYHFLGMLHTDHTPTLAIDSTVNCPASFHTTAAGAAIQGETADYAHTDAVGTDGIGNLYYSFYYLANTYTVSFHANGGSGTMNDQILTYDAEAALNANAFTRLGYSFAGWAATQNGSVLYTDGQPVLNLTGTDNAVVNLYACWNVDTYTITYDTNGGSISDTLYSSTYTILTGPTLPHAQKAGYTFLGWRANDAGNWSTVTYAAGKLAAGKHGHVQLTARWSTISYTVSFNSNGGTGTMTNQTFTYDESKALTANAFSRTGYKFAGWAMQAQATVPQYGDKATVSALTTVADATVTLYAVWTPVTYSILYNTGNGTIGESGYAQSYTIEGTVRLPANVTRTGYAFGGWKAAAAVGNWNISTVYSGTLNTGMYGNVTLQAVWTATDYVIRYDPAGGAVSGTNYSTDYDIEAAVTLPRAAKTGYAFTGWKADGAGNWGTSVYPAGRVAAGKYGDVWLTAQWTGISYSVSFNGNHSTSGIMYNQTLTYGTEARLTMNAYARTGYTFCGWAASDTAAEPTYTDGEPVRNLSSVSGSTVVLYAVWRVNTYSITYVFAGGTALSESYAESYSIDDALNLPQTIRAGYTFGGWKANGAGNWGTACYQGDLAAGKYGNVTLTAQWTLTEYMVTFDPNGGTISGSCPTQYDVSRDIPLPVVTREGYTFDGWKASWNGLLYFDAIPAGLYGNITLTAQWTQMVYYVSFNGNGADAGTMEQQTFGMGNEQALSANTFTRTGYSFAGWSLTDTGTAAYADGAAVRNLTDTQGQTVTLYAVWNARSFSVQYNLNGASGSMLATSVVMDGAAVTLRNCTITQAVINGAAYTFGGWAFSAEDAASGIAAYPNKGSFSLNGTVLQNAQVNWSAAKPTITLYAVWLCAEVELYAGEGSSTVIDRDRGFIYGLKISVTEQELDEVFLQVDGNGHLEYESSGFVGTGTTVKLIDDNTGTVKETYTLVIFGDVNGDGIVNSTDTALMKSMVIGAVEKVPGSAQSFAADLNGDATINTSDLTVINSMVSKTGSMNQATREMVIG